MNGIEMIAAERQRQIDNEGWSELHDDQHTRGELEDAARCYWQCAESAGTAIRILEGTNDPDWPWELKWFKPWEENRGTFPAIDKSRCLIKAGSLMQAEIDRLDRCANSEADVDRLYVNRNRLHEAIRRIAAELEQLTTSKA